MDEALLRIGEIAAFFNLSVKALRVYEKMGLLKPVKVDPQSGYRYYSPDQVKQLDALLELRELGFSLAEIKKLLTSSLTKEQYMEVLVHQKAKWQDKISMCQGKIEDLDEIIQKLATAQPPTKLHQLSEEERAYLLSKMVCLENLHAHNVLSEVIWL